MTSRNFKLAIGAGAVVGGALLLARYGRQQLAVQLAGDGSPGGFSAGEIDSLNEQTSFWEAVKAGARALAGQLPTGIMYTTTKA